MPEDARDGVDRHPGVGIEYVRTPGYLVAAGRPIWQSAPVVPPPPPLIIPQLARRTPVLVPTLTI